LKTCIDAAQVLEEFGASGCFFVCPAAIDRSADEPWIARWCASALKMPPARVMSWGDLERLQSMGHEIGNHTMHHVDLAATPAAARSAEIHLARQALISRLGEQAGKHFAWPYGEARHIDAHALSEVWSAGHTTCASAVRGVHVPSASEDPAPVLLRNHAVFLRPVAATMFFMRRNVRKGATHFCLPRK